MTLQRVVRAYTCQNATLLEISCTGSIINNYCTFAVHYLHPKVQPKSSNFLTDRSKTALLLRILFLLFVFNVVLSCLFLAALWSPAGKELTSWFSCRCCFNVFLSISHKVSWLGVVFVYGFLIFSFFLTFFLK